MSQPSKPTVSTLPPRPTFALPSKPTSSIRPIPRDLSLSAVRLTRVRSPSPTSSRRDTDSYVPYSSRRTEPDRYVPSTSPEPPRRRSTDSYRPTHSTVRSNGDSYRPSESLKRSRRDYSTSPSPDKRRSVRRSPSPVSSRHYSRSSRSTSRSRTAWSPEQSQNSSRVSSDLQRSRQREPERREYSQASPVRHQPRRSPSPVREKRAKLSNTPAEIKQVSTPASAPLFPKIQSNDRSIPTGPRADRQGLPSFQPDHISPSSSETLAATEPHPTDGEDDMTQTRGRGRGRSTGSSRQPSSRRTGASSSKPPATPTIIQPPLYDRTFILNSYSQGGPLKPQWAENPKSPLANHLGSNNPINYNATHGVLGGQKIVRVTVLADPATGLTGIGDAPNQKDAEKLAALSAVLQLQAAGLLDGKSKGGPSGPSGPSPSMAPAASGGGGETVKLSDGSSISYDRARQFMDYYCQRYNFTKPEIDFTQSSTAKKGKSKGTVQKWEATLSVGGRVIGMGEAASKKNAQVKTYLDVTQYLESCDPELWKAFTEFSNKDPMKDLGMAPHLVFQMSDKVNDDIQDMSEDIRRSTLFTNAPTSGVNTEAQALPTWRSGGRGQASQAELERKNQVLQDRLLDYHSDAKMDKMRKQRDSLPITVRATDILTKVQLNDVTIVMAATGSGKTTQVPQILFDDYINKGEGAHCNIICTQPRRLAAMSVAERIADERGQRLGGEIGYQVRFDTKPPEPDGSITFCTTGIFLKRMQSALGAGADPTAIAQMDKVTHIVVDEVHERDIDTDLSLVVLKRLLADRKARKKPIKVILMSATIDPTLFKQYFLDDRGRPAPVVEVPGRTFPVQRHYLDEITPELRSEARSSSAWVFQEKSVVDYLNRELQPDKMAFNSTTGMDLEIPYPLVALTIAYVLRRSEDGHVLVFLPGWDEIKKVANILLDTSGRFPLMNTRFSDASQYSIHYLHSTIPAAEQKEVFNPPPKGVRRVILATNIAETSITIPDVVYVVDAARVKEKRYDPERHMSSLVSAWVGSSNLNQRAGRAGRHREGEYFGLLSQNRYNALETHQTVEMMRSDLSNVVMHVKALNLGVVEEVMAAVIEPPEPSRIVAAMDTLRMLGAMDSEKNLTSLGRVLLQLPVEAAIGKLCLYGSFFRCLDSALTLAAILTNRDPFLAPVDLKREADEIKDSWSPTSFRSDPLAIWAAYNEWIIFEESGQWHKASQFCQANFLAKSTLLQIKQVKGSLLQSLDQAGVVAVSAGGNVRRIGRRTEVPRELNENGGSLPLLAALIAMASAPNFALRTSEKSCRTSQDKTVFIHQSSVNSRKRETGGPELPSTSFNPAEKRLYAFTEKSRNVPLGNRGGGAMTYLRNVTRLDPLTYMLFGAYNLVVTRRGLECDNWLPVTGNLYALDDLQRLKALFERCMLRVFEGVGKSLIQGRDARRRDTRANVDVRKSSSRLNASDDRDGDDDAEEGEMESDDEDTNGADGGYQASKAKRQAGPLSLEEVKELEMLTTDVVRVLEAYANEREGGSVAVSRPVSRPITPGLGSGANGSYKPPGRR